MDTIEFVNGQSPYLSAENLNQMQENANEHEYVQSITADTDAGATVTLSQYYKVGKNTLDVYLNGEYLICTTSDDTEGTNGHYFEVGDTDTISNQITITTDWNLEAGDVLKLVIRGEWSA